MEPYYELDLTTRNRIIGLIHQCEISNLGNVSFEYYERPRQDAYTFRVEKNNKGWELGVNGKYTKTRDIYKIIGDQIAHDYSEKD